MDQEFSAGGVVYRVEEGEPLILMIQDRFGRWTLPKGVVEQGEPPPAAALREIEEETGVTGQVERMLGQVSYFYSDPDRGRVAKKVVYYLVRALDRDLKPQPGEVAAVSWIPISEAIDRCAYDNNRALLAQAAGMLPGRPYQPLFPRK